MPPNNIKTQVIHTTRKGKSILLFSPYFELFCRITLFPYSYNNNAVTQCHVDGFKGAWATCA